MNEWFREIEVYLWSQHNPLELFKLFINDKFSILYSFLYFSLFIIWLFNLVFFLVFFKYKHELLHCLHIPWSTKNPYLRF